MSAPETATTGRLAGTVMVRAHVQHAHDFGRVIDPHAGARGWVVTAPRLLKHDPDGRELPTRPATCSAVFDLEPGDGEAVEDLARDVLNVLGDAMEVTDCAVLLGTRFTLIAGTGDAVAQACVVRRSGWSRAAFSTYWLTRHAALAGRVEGASGYQQMHTDVPRTEALARRLGCRPAPFDGIGRLLFGDERAMADARATPEVRRDATEDEMRFIDHARSEVMSLQSLRAMAAGAW